MASTSIEKLEAEIIALKARTAGVRSKANEKAKGMQRDAVSLIAAYGFGAYKRSRADANQQPFSILGLDPEASAVILLYGGGMVIDGEAGEWAHDAAIGIGCSYAGRKGEGR